MSDVKFNEEHAWVRVEDDMATIGITDYAQERLGNVSYIELPEEGAGLSIGEEFGLIESDAATSDLIAPISGDVIETNHALTDDPSIINDSPYEDGWIVRVRLIDASELDDLLSEEEYEQLISKN